MSTLFRPGFRLASVLALCVFALALTASGSAAATTYSSHLRRYPYLTDAVNSYATINWGTDQFYSSGAVRWGKVGTESCTAHYQPASRTVVKVNSVAEYQWKAILSVAPDTQYCYRVYLGSSPTREIDLLHVRAVRDRDAGETLSREIQPIPGSRHEKDRQLVAADAERAGRADVHR
jgi:hypothetical protein